MRVVRVRMKVRREMAAVVLRRGCLVGLEGDNIWFGWLVDGWWRVELGSARLGVYVTVLESNVALMS